MHQCNDSGRNVLALHASLKLGEHPHRLLAVPRLGVDVPSPTQPAALAIARLNELVHESNGVGKSPLLHVRRRQQERNDGLIGGDLEQPSQPLDSLIVISFEIRSGSRDD